MDTSVTTAGRTRFPRQVQLIGDDDKAPRKSKFQQMEEGIHQARNMITDVRADPNWAKSTTSLADVTPTIRLPVRTRACEALVGGAEDHPCVTGAIQCAQTAETDSRVRQTTINGTRFAVLSGICTSYCCQVSPREFACVRSRSYDCWPG
jgi:hypothetical protein